MKRLIIFCLVFSVFAHSQTENEIKTLRDKWTADKLKNEIWQRELNSKLMEDEANLSKALVNRAKLDDLIQNKKSYVDKAIQQADNALHGLSVTERVVSRRAAFFRCIRSDLKRIQFVNVQTCKNTHDGNFTADDEKLIKDWSETVGMSTEQINSKKYQIDKEIGFNNGKIEQGKKFLASAGSIQKNILDSEKEINRKEEDQKVIEANTKFINCDSNTPDISLEEQMPFSGAKFQGPFFGVSRDNQDGLGTCYANTAKNLLIGVSGGNDVASFLDLALIYKGNSGVVSDGLDAGFSCETLKKMKEVGYCPQEFAPVERGEKNIYVGGLMGSEKGNIYEQSRLITLLRDFFEGQDRLAKGNKVISEQMLLQAEVIIHNIKVRPNVVIPLPIVRHHIPGKWKVLELSYLKTKSIGHLLQSKMVSDYDSEYQNFYPHYIRAVTEGKNRDEIFAIFQEKMKPYIDKYQIADQMPSWKMIFLNETEADWKSPSLKKDIASSVEFMKIMSGMQKASDEEFLKHCDNTKGNISHFLSSLQPLIIHLGDQKIDTNVLFDEKGKFRSAADLIQLAIAPSCLKKENRKFPLNDFTCDGGYSTISNIRNSGKPIPEQKKMFRERVVLSLVQGLALGNTFGSAPMKHINTLVGMRFNKESHQCEFKIRESQTGTSFWQSEDSVFSKIDALTEVRKK